MDAFLPVGFAASDAFIFIFIFIFISEPSPSQLLQEQHRPPLYVESRSPVESYQKLLLVLVITFQLLDTRLVIIFSSHCYS